jgi:hypothetical protein
MTIRNIPRSGYTVSLHFMVFDKSYVVDIVLFMKLKTL